MRIPDESAVRLTRGAEIDRERDLAKEALMPKAESRKIEGLASRLERRGRKRGTENEFVV